MWTAIPQWRACKHAQDKSSVAPRRYPLPFPIGTDRRVQFVAEPTKHEIPPIEPSSAAHESISSTERMWAVGFAHTNTGTLALKRDQAPCPACFSSELRPCAALVLSTGRRASTQGSLHCGGTDFEVRKGECGVGKGASNRTKWTLIQRCQSPSSTIACMHKRQ